MGAFHLNNIIGIDSLDLPVEPNANLYGTYELLVLDPGAMVGWAGIRGFTRQIEVGQAEWHECLRWYCEDVVIERTPFAAQRTFDVWPLYYTGAVVAKVYPREPRFVLPTDLKVAQQWYSLPRRHGLGPHAKDALTHLVGVLVKDGR